jgi:hypothetical protein
VRRQVGALRCQQGVRSAIRVLEDAESRWGGLARRSQYRDDDLELAQAGRSVQNVYRQKSNQQDHSDFPEGTPLAMLARLFSVWIRGLVHGMPSLARI